MLNLTIRNKKKVIVTNTVFKGKGGLNFFILRQNNEKMNICINSFYGKEQCILYGTLLFNLFDYLEILTRKNL